MDYFSNTRRNDQESDYRYINEERDIKSWEIDIELIDELDVGKKEQEEKSTKNVKDKFQGHTDYGDNCCSKDHEEKEGMLMDFKNF